MIPNDKSMIKEMVGIIIVFGLVVAVFEVIFAKRTAYSLFGLVIGCILAVYMLLYMNIILGRCMDAGNGYEAKAIEKYVVKHSVIRYLSIVLVFGAVCITNIADPITLILAPFKTSSAANSIFGICNSPPI